MSTKPAITIQIKENKFLLRLFLVLVGCEVTIFFLDFIINFLEMSSIGSIQRMVNITREDGVSNFFSSTHLLVVGFVLWMIVYAIQKQTIEQVSRKTIFGWGLLATFFTYMGIDDGIKFHERMGTAFKIYANRFFEGMASGEGNVLVDFFPSYPWQLLFGPLFFAMGIFILWFLWKELRDKKQYYLVLTAICLYIIAVAMDFVEGLENPYEGVADFLTVSPAFIKHMSKSFEEVFEMLGTTLFLVVFLKKLMSFSSVWTLKIGDRH